MSDPKMFNADALLSEARAIKLHGKDHPEKLLSVKEYLQFVREADAVQKELEASKDVSEEDKGSAVIDSYYRVINAAFPTITREDIEKSTMRQLSALASFCVEKDIDDSAEDADGKK